MQQQQQQQQRQQCGTKRSQPESPAREVAPCCQARVNDTIPSEEGLRLSVPIESEFGGSRNLFPASRSRPAASQEQRIGDSDEEGDRDRDEGFNLSVEARKKRRMVEYLDERCLSLKQKLRQAKEDLEDEWEDLEFMYRNEGYIYDLHAVPETLGGM